MLKFVDLISRLIWNSRAKFVSFSVLFHFPCRKVQQRKRSTTIEEDHTSTASTSSKFPDAQSNGGDVRERRDTITNSNSGNLIMSIKKMFNPGFAGPTTDNFNRTSTFCVSSSIPTREVSRWVDKIKLKKDIIVFFFFLLRIVQI